MCVDDDHDDETTTSVSRDCRTWVEAQRRSQIFGCSIFFCVFSRDCSISPIPDVRQLTLFLPTNRSRQRTTPTDCRAHPRTRLFYPTLNHGLFSSSPHPHIKMVRPSCRPCTSAAAARCARLATRQTRTLHQTVWAHQVQESQNQQHPQQPRPARTPRPRRAGGISFSVSARDFHSTPTNAGIAGRLGDIARQAISRTAEPYGAFGITRTIYQKCTRPAAYDISEETRRSDQVPTTEDGEELGVGGGLWHDGKTTQPIS